MLRLPAAYNSSCKINAIRNYTSSNHIRKAYIDFFKNDFNHKVVSSSSVIPLCDPTVPFVNAGMNQFKGVFLGSVTPPANRVVNSQKCIRVGGKHNDLDIVGTDGHHHTFFEMLGNWSFGDYYKVEACDMAWKLLTGPYQLDPKRLLVTYFAGDETLSLREDEECKVIWKAIGIPDNNLKPLGKSDNFWEMGLSGPCGPCTELHYINDDGSLIELWNLVFIQFNREMDGSITLLPQHHVDTGMGLERMVALLNGAKSNYDTDLFLPLIKDIHKISGKVNEYSASFGKGSELDTAYRTLADHSRLISICLSDGMFPSTNLNLKQVMRKSFRISQDVFQCKSGLVQQLYCRVAEILGSTYPELQAKLKNVKLILDYEENSYKKMRSELSKKWSGLLKMYPEVENLGQIELSGFVEGYKQFKKTMSSQNSPIIPGDIVFLLYDTHGFDLETINKIASVNNLQIDVKGFETLLNNHKSRHKTSFKEQNNDNKGKVFNKVIERLKKAGIKSTNDQYKYNYDSKNMTVPKLKTNLLAVLNENCEWLDEIIINRDSMFYIITEDTNFYCEEGGQTGDKGVIILDENVHFKVGNVFKIKDIVFHKGNFVYKDDKDANINADVNVCVDSERRLDIMRNHTGVHLLNAAVRKVLPDCVICQVGSKVTEDGFSLSLAVYGDKLTPKAVLEMENYMRQAINSGAEVKTSIVSESQIGDDVLRLPGERYPDNGLRLLHFDSPLFQSKELCCGTHVSDISSLIDINVIRVRGAASHTPTIYGVTGRIAIELRDISKHIETITHNELDMDHLKLKEVINDMRSRLEKLFTGPGAPFNCYKTCMDKLQALEKGMKERNETALNAMYEMELAEARSEAANLNRDCVVHFLKCSYLSDAAEDVCTAVQFVKDTPAMLLACSNGIIGVACRVPQSYLTKEFDSEKWLSCILPIFNAQMDRSKSRKYENIAIMQGTKVSLITCEGLVQDAMRVAIAFAKRHTKPDDRGMDHDRPQVDQRRN